MEIVQLGCLVAKDQGGRATGLAAHDRHLAKPAAQLDRGFAFNPKHQGYRTDSQTDP
jgi:hypothetical protein